MDVDTQVAGGGSGATDALPIAGADGAGASESWADVDDFTPGPAVTSEASVTTDDSAQAGAVSPKPDEATDDKAIIDLAQGEGAAAGGEKAPEGDAGVVKPAVEGDQAALDAAAAVAAAGIADPELSAEENAVVKALPAADQPAAIERFKRAPFMDHYLSEKPIEEIRAHLETRSPSRYAEMTSAVIQTELADPVRFAEKLFTQDDKLFGKVADALFKGDPKYYAGVVARRNNAEGRPEADPEYVQKAVDFYDKNKDRITDEEPEVLSPEEIESIGELHPEIAPKLKKILDAAGDRGKIDPSIQERLDKLKQIEAAEEKKSATTQTTAEQLVAAEIDKLYDKAYATVDSFLQNKLDDPKDGLGLKVTDAERIASPDVANLKTLKRTVLLKGFGDDLPDFEDGLGKWGEPKPEFMEIGKALGKFTAAREEQNAIAKAKGLLPFADKYLNERLEHPFVKWIDAQILAATGRAGAKPPVETFVPGGGQAPTGGKESSWDNVDDFEPAR